MHIDFNSYFASVEQQANPFLRGKAIGVGGKPGTRSVVAAASIEAKQRGIRTAMSSSKAAQIDPELMMIHGDPRKYSEMTDRFSSILERHASVVMRTSVDEAFIDVADNTNDWLDSLALALRIKRDIEGEIGARVTVSIGISDNPLMAKIASESEKPNGLTIVYPEEKLEFLNKVELQDIPGIGRAILRRLEEQGIGSVSKLRTCPLPWLVRNFKQYGAFLYQASRGLDSSKVIDCVVPPKSVGHSYTLPYDACMPNQVKGTFLMLAERVAWRLRKHSLSARRYTVVVRNSDMRFAMKQGRLDAPTQDGMELFLAAWPKIRRHVEASKVRLVGIVAHDLVPAHEQQATNKTIQKRAKLLPSLDKIQARYGKNSWMRAAMLGSTLHERASGLKYDHKLYN